MYKIRLIFFLICFAACASDAQSLQPTVIASDGGFFSSGSGSISWTLGEPISETFSSTANHLTQGFHQPFGLLVSGIPGAFTFGPFVYPNPSSGAVYINMSQMPAGTYEVQLFDALGKKLGSSLVSGGDNKPVPVSISDYANGMYLMKISSSYFEQSFRIIKTN